MFKIIANKYQQFFTTTTTNYNSNNKIISNLKYTIITHNIVLIE